MADELPKLHTPEQVAAALGFKSTWWLVEQARRGRIPHTRLGRSYRFTDQQVEDIVRLNEFRPARPVTAPAPAPPRQIEPPPDNEPQQRSRLRARPPKQQKHHQQWPH